MPEKLVSYLIRELSMAGADMLTHEEIEAIKANPPTDPESFLDRVVKISRQLSTRGYLHLLEHVVKTFEGWAAHEARVKPPLD